MSADQSLSKLSELLMRKLNHELNDEDHTRLKDWLAEDAKARQYYVEFMALNAQLRQQRVASVASAPLDIDLSKDTPSDMEAFSEWLEKTGLNETEPSGPRTEHVNEIRRIADERLQAFMEEQEQKRRQQALYDRYQAASPSLFAESFYLLAKRVYVTVTWPLKHAVQLTAVASVILLGLALIQYALHHRIVATLDEVVNAQWDYPPNRCQSASRPHVPKRGFRQTHL